MVKTSCHKRIVELDLAKSFTLVITLVGIHTFYHLTELSVNESPIGYVLNILSGTFGAPIFMFCMGMGMAFTKNGSTTSLFRRGVIILTGGMALNLLRYLPAINVACVYNEPDHLGDLANVFNVDIMQFAGLAFMLNALCQRLRMGSKSMLVFAVALNLIGSLLEGCSTQSYVVNQILGYFYPTPTCCCFPLFNWYIFVAVGHLFSELYRRGDINLTRFYSYIIPICGIVTAVYLYLVIWVELPCLRVLQGDWGLYWMNPYDAIPTAFAAIPFSLGVFWLIGKIIPDKWIGVLAYPSIHINQFYCVSWVWIAWTADLFLFVPKATSNAAFVLIWTIMNVLTLASVFVYNRWLRQSIVPWFSRHSAAWIIGIWVAVMAFGIWFFNCVDVPYIFPY